MKGIEYICIHLIGWTRFSFTRLFGNPSGYRRENDLSRCGQSCATLCFFPIMCLLYAIFFTSIIVVFFYPQYIQWKNASNTKELQCYLSKRAEMWALAWAFETRYTNHAWIIFYSFIFYVYIYISYFELLFSVEGKFHPHAWAM